MRWLKSRRRISLVALRGPITFQSDPLLGFRYRPNLDVHRLRDGCDWTFTTNERGQRITPENPTAESHPTVVLVGDSFAFGDGVSDDETVAAALAAHGLHVENLGVTGYGPHQELLSLRDYLAQNPVPDWIVTLTYTNDESDVLSSYQSMHYQPYARLADGKLLIAPFDSPVTDWLTDRSYLSAIVRGLLFNQPVRNDGDGPAIVAACLTEIENQAASVGAGCLTLAHDAVEPQRILPIVDAARKAGVCITDLSPLFVSAREQGQDLICPDGYHWNAAGSQFVADTIVDWINRSTDSAMSTEPWECVRVP